MIQFPQRKQDKEPGRNEPCPCGSGKKYKRCCLTKKEFAEGKVDVETMLKLFYCLVRGLKPPKDPRKATLIVTKRTVDEKVPDDWAEQMSILTGLVKGKECYLIHLKQEEGPLIAAPNRSIILPNDN